MQILKLRAQLCVLCFERFHLSLETQIVAAAAAADVSSLIPEPAAHSQAHFSGGLSKLGDVVAGTG